MQSTKVKVVMTRHPTLIDPESSLYEAAQKMEALDCGILPVGNSEQLEGIITDRDIVLRCVAKGKDAQDTQVQECMTPELIFCREEDTLEYAATLMHQHHVNRLLVKDETNAFTGIITFGCMLRKDADKEEIGEVVDCAVGRKAA